MHVETLAIHGAHGADAATGAVAPPIYLSTTFERAADGSLPHGYLYARDATPNRTALERVLATLEGGAAAAAFSAGQAATMAVFQSLAPGDHVIGCLSAFCGTCEYCLGGRPNLCEGEATMRRPGEPPRLSKDGAPIGQFVHLSAFAERMLVHENALVKIRTDMPLDRAALIGCGVTTGLGAALNTARVRAGRTTAVIGCGGVGLSAIQGCRIAGAGRVIAVDTALKQRAERRHGGQRTLGHWIS